MPADPSTIQAATDIVNAGSALISAMQGFVVQLLTSAAAVIAGSAVIAKYLPPPEQPGFLSKLHKIINAAGQNAGYAANARKQEE
ncbi:MAG: hypothetical protein ACXV8Q_09315 [Methylobacter sp.]